MTGFFLLAIPLVYVTAALLPLAGTKNRIRSLWRRAACASVATLGLATFSAVYLIWNGPGFWRLAVPIPLAGFGPLRFSLRLDAPSAVMLGLISFIGVVILQYSRRYLDGDPGQTRYVRWFLAILSAVSLLVTANHLALLWLAWFATSIALHQLLTFYDDRPPALIAAHKKFLTSRIADVCLLIGFTLLSNAAGSGELDQIFRRIAVAESLWPSAGLAAVLLATAAALKCAQLPFHGWLIQVMEAPTPVSALLHAGVVNIGGFLMIRLAPLMVEAEGAQTLLVAVGSVTAVLASLVMMTRVSIKVSLAWSTSAQMGFMLVECGLGAYSLALLHLLAHSLYKAHAFLASGSTVETWRTQTLVAPAPKPSLVAWIGAGVVSLAALCGVASLLESGPQTDPVLFVLTAIVAVAVTPLVARSVGQDALRAAKYLGGAVLIAGAYLIWHALFERLLATPPGAQSWGMLRVAIVAAAFGLLFVIQVVLETRPHGRLALALYPPLFAGLYLDELFTRLTFRVWPAKLPSLPPPPQTLTLRHDSKENSQ
ncbi:MAG: NADH-quinone oxidoreductase subunit L [Pirellulales bacterium]